MPAKTKEVQLDFVIRRDKREFRLRRRPSEVERSNERALARIKQAKEQAYRRGINAPPSLLDTKRIILFDDKGQPNSAGVVLIQRDRKTKEPEAWLYRSRIPGKMPVEWDQRIMWIIALETHPNLEEWRSGPAIDLKATFQGMHLEGGEGFVVQHGGIVFDPTAPNHGLYSRFIPASPKIARLLGLPQ